MVITSQAALIFNDFGTDASGAFVNPATTGWTDTAGGVGTVVGPSGSTITGNNKMLEGVRSGELSLGATTGYIDGPRNGTLSAGVTTTLAVNIGSATSNGTGDIYTSGANPGGAFPNGPLNFTVTNLANANSVTMTFSFSHLLAAMDGNSTFAVGGLPTFMSSYAGAPFLGAMRGNGATANYDLNISYSGLVSSTDGVNFQNGLVAGTTSFGLSASDIMFSGTSASETNIAAGGSAWQGTHGFDVTPGNGFEIGLQNDGAYQDAEKVYADGISFTVTKAGGGNFAASDEFIFSLNGNIWTESATAAANPIPEPTAGALGLLAGLSFLTRRRRK